MILKLTAIIAAMLSVIPMQSVACELDGLDPWPTCDESHPVEISDAARYAAGILRLKKTWYSCGRLLDDEKKAAESVQIAVAVDASMKRLGADFTPWGVLGVMANESSFDRCALGLHPRKWAYSQDLIKPRRRGISHEYREVLRFIESRKARERFATTGFDLGLCQVLSRFYPGEERAMMTIHDGVGICIAEMVSRGTKTPWLYWRGSATEWYRNKIRNWARAMGAPISELRKI